jgi:hypothetical protein
MARIKSVPLISQKARVAELAEAEKLHKQDCTAGSCKELDEIRAELKEARRLLASWFDPSSDQETLF